jgi:hypothetical protein
MTKNKIFIYRGNKASFIKRFFDKLIFFSFLAFSFYFNYKFIGGNDFFDVIIFISFFSYIIAIFRNSCDDHYVTEKQFQEIKKILGVNND